MTHLQFAKTPFAAWGICGIIAAVIFLGYVAASVHTGGGEVIAPLDDAYIHFQYARQLANGQPYVYNPGQPPTSGATSFIYPYVLAAGYLLGFQGLSLGLWAMGVGAFAFAASGGLVYLLARLYAPFWLSLVLMLAFMLNGAVSWHFMSGMETGLVVLFTLVTLYTFITSHFRGFILAVMLLALTRPEGSIMTLVAVIAMAAHITEMRLATLRQNRHLLWLVIPLMAMAAQPMLNLLLTGSASAAGSQAKSIFGIIPFSWEMVISRIWDNFSRVWVEFATGTGGYYTPALIPLLAGMGLVYLLVKREHRVTGLMLVAWFLTVTAAISTLDTAFWHFKRYQMPLIALFFPLAAWGVGWIWVKLENREPLRAVGAVLVVVYLAFSSIITSAEFLRLYRVNVENIAAQPLPMARWLAENTPLDAVVAVHDVGMMRYLGNRTTIDMVGLTTPGAADAWRHGPGAVAEFLIAHDPRPDYVAAYTTARGLNYLADTGIYGELLAGFTAEYDPADNVALGAEFQGIYSTDWSLIEGDTTHPLQGSLNQYLTLTPMGPTVVVDEINVADLESEVAHDYQWENRGHLPGFSTEVYQFSYLSCPQGLIRSRHAPMNGCAVTNGGRRINGEEAFTIRAQFPDADVLLITRLHPAARGAIDVYVNDTWIDTQWIPENPGHWLEVATYIPSEYVTEQMRIRIVPEVGSGYYSPYRHWMIQGQEGLFVPLLQDPELVTFQDDAFGLMSLSCRGTIYCAPTENLDQTGNVNHNVVHLTWQTDGSAQGDYVMFFHLYEDINQPPIWQVDRRPGEGTMPPGNWPPGIFTDGIVVDLTDIPAGTYQAAIGFYDPVTLERLVPSDERPNDGIFVDEHNRVLFVVEVNDD